MTAGNPPTNEADAALAQVHEYLDDTETQMTCAEYELLLRILCMIGRAADGTVDVTLTPDELPHFTQAVREAATTCIQMLKPAIAGDGDRLRAIVEGFETELRLLANDAAILDGILLATAVE